MSSTENVEFIAKLKIAISKILIAKIKFRAMYDEDTKNLTDNLNRIQTDSKFPMEYIKICVIYDTNATENPKTVKMDC